MVVMGQYWKWWRLVNSNKLKKKNEIKCSRLLFASLLNTKRRNKLKNNEEESNVEFYYIILKNCYYSGVRVAVWILCIPCCIDDEIQIKEEPKDNQIPSNSQLTMVIKQNKRR